MILQNDTLCIYFSLSGAKLFVKCTGEEILDLPNERFISGAISKDGNLIALCDDNKNLRIYDKNGNEKYKRPVQRRISAMKFSSKNDLIFSDKFGDLYRFPFDNAAVDLLGGHVSMVTDIHLTATDSLLISCDRDEKIRLTRYPKSHLIYGFCLGHKSFVSRICIPEFNHQVLVSGGGDDELFLWDILRCKLLHQLDFFSLIRKKTTETETEVAIRVIESMKIAKNILVSNEKSRMLFLFSITPKSTLQYIDVIQIQGYIMSVSVSSDDSIWVESIDDDSSYRLDVLELVDGKLKLFEEENKVQKILNEKINSMDHRSIFVLNQLRKLPENDKELKGPFKAKKAKLNGK